MDKVQKSNNSEYKSSSELLASTVPYVSASIFTFLVLELLHWVSHDRTRRDTQFDLCPLKEFSRLWHLAESKGSTVTRPSDVV
jgi:hypothetical protein